MKALPRGVPLVAGAALALLLLASLAVPGRGAEWTPPDRVTPRDGSSLTALHEVAAAGSALHLVHARIGPDARDDRLAYQRSVDGGASWSAERTLFASTGQDRYLIPNLALDADGSSVLVAWRVRGPDGTRLFARWSPDGGATWSARRELAATSRIRGIGVPAVSVEAGTGIVAWTDRGDGDIALRRTVDAGATWGERRVLGRSLLSITCAGDPVTDGLVGLASAGATVHLAWSSAQQGACISNGVQVRTSRDGGRTWGAARTATSTRSYGWPELAAAGSRLLFSLQRPDGGLVVVRSRDGGRSFAEERFPAGSRDRALGAADVLLPRGSIAWIVYADITYEGDAVDGSRLRFRTSRDGGASWGPASTIVSYARKLRQAANLAVAGGTPVVVFQSGPVDGSDRDIFATRAR
jgi:hypothetical protein